jgi:serine/threonine-protein kinase
LGAAALLFQIQYYLTADGRLSRHLLILTVLAGWGLIVMVTQKLRSHPIWRRPLHYATASADMIFCTLLLHWHNAGASQLVAIYPLLIIIAGLWFRDRLVWFSTALAMIGYILLVWTDWNLASPRLSGYIFFLLTLAITGFIVGFQARRIRALSRYRDQ